MTYAGMDNLHRHKVFRWGNNEIPLIKKGRVSNEMNSTSLHINQPHNQRDYKKPKNDLRSTMSTWTRSWLRFKTSSKRARTLDNIRHCLAVNWGEPKSPKTHELPTRHDYILRKGLSDLMIAVHNDTRVNKKYNSTSTDMDNI